MKRNAQVTIKIKGHDSESLQTQALVEYLENDTNWIKVIAIEPIVVHGKLVNFDGFEVFLHIDFEGRLFTSTCTTLTLIKQKGLEPVYVTGVHLKSKNRREAFRVYACYKATARKDSNGGVIECRCYDMSQSGIGLLVEKDTPCGVGESLCISLHLDDGSILKTEGTVIRRAESKYPTSDILGVRLSEKGRTLAYSKQVMAEQVKGRHGRSYIK